MWSDVRLVTANLNGVKDNGSSIAASLVASHDVVCLQETRFRDVAHESRFNFHVQALSTHRLFTSNFSSTSPHHPRCGVATMGSARFPGAAAAQVVHAHTVPGRYLVIQTSAAGTDIMIHNIYAPCVITEKSAFYAHLSQ